MTMSWYRRRWKPWSGECMTPAVDLDSSLSQISFPSYRTRSQVVEKLMQYLRSSCWFYSLVPRITS